ncbi:hypothetical protein [Dokdonia sp. 4H-3-7-5]|uniref:hypothetical protein n=1 Tax=Dokdonia sp. (strain 4H-3-7-5) TaxID=983548 RepID=UPI00020A6F69|nr:hypothetical protein [Dokdonia sp. 4H-3-7-5]AEE19662.1 hypothetical protein Krodi_1679 [Dokdonia sp. 4H-3-7-5]
MITTLSLTSCSKEDIELTNESQNTEAAFTLEQVPETNIISFDLPARGRSQGGNATMLSFASIEDFVAAAEELEVAIEAHEDKFVAQYDHLTDDELDDMEESTQFDSRAPLRQFQQTRSFSNSLFNSYETKETIWLDDEILDENKDPSLDNLFEEEEMVLLNQDQEVMIDGKVFNFGHPQLNYEIIGNFGESILKVRNDEDVSNDPNIITTSKASSSCTSWKRSWDRDNYAHNKRVKRSVSIRSLPFWTKTKSKVESFRKRGNRWKRHRTRLGVGLQKNLKASACFGATVRQGYKSKSRKKRKKRKVIMTDHPGMTLKARNGQGVVGDYYYGGKTTYKALSW